MALPNGSGGYQVGAGNRNEFVMGVAPAPATVPAGAATLTAAQLQTGLILGSPGSSAATYTLPTVALLDAAIPSATVGSTFDFSVINVDGSGSGVITIGTASGWSIGTSGSQGLMTVAATAGTAGHFRARKTGDGAWSLYRIAS
jgi:hypothetical protein